MALVPASLRAVGLLSAAGMLDVSDLDLDQEVDVLAMTEKWENMAPPMFEVSVDPDTAEARLQDFIEEVELDARLLGNSWTSLGANTSFYALSLMADGTPVEVRIGFVWFFALAIHSSDHGAAVRFSTRI